MQPARTLFAFLFLCLAGVAATQIPPTLAQSDRGSGAAPEPDFEFFRTEVQPIFLAKRGSNVRCIQCHTRSSGFRLQPLDEGAHFWTEEQSRMNFASARAFVVPGADPLQSRFLTHPLDASAGGDPFHGGGKHFANRSDPEWRIMAAWAAGAVSRAPAADTVVRIIQTNAAGDNSHIIDPVSNTVAGVIEDVEIPHGVTSAPDGSAIYLSNESMHSLDIIDARTLRVKRRVALSGRPNNVAVSKDGSKVYVGIMEMPGAVDIIDTVAMEKIKTLPVEGAIHNVYVTPDGRHAVAGSIQTRTINVIDTSTDELAWTLEMSAGIRPMIFDTNADGSTRNIYVQLSDFHGFAVVDFNTRKEVARIEHPAVPGEPAHLDGLQAAPAHGLGVSPDGKTLWSTSKVYSHAYVHSLPDLKEIGRVFVGQHPEWITFTPDGKTAYIGAAGDNATYAVDTATLTVVAKIGVGQTPKRIGTVLMQVD
ncbi:MAG: YncE family protein [Gammaproteobacteria bacterium]|nr:YncE family protein [Gammaproteobacteria bacterium]